MEEKRNEQVTVGCHAGAINQSLENKMQNVMLKK